MTRLEKCVTDHTQLSSQAKLFQDWIAYFRDETQGLADTCGEKAETKKKVKQIEELQCKFEHGRRQLDDVKQLCSTVTSSTSPRGCELLAKNMASLQEELDGVVSSLEETKRSQEAILQRWQSFEDGMESCNAWLRQQEAALGDQHLQVTLPDKEAQMTRFQAVRDAVVSYEPQIDAFVDQATALFQSSGVERLRPLISQISSKYQQLHVLSMEVVSKWQGIVDDHRHYEDKFYETVAWLTSLEDTLETLLKSKDQSSGTSVGIQNLMAEKEQASHRLGSLTSAGERLFPDTASTGREKIRQDLKLLRARWEDLEWRLSERHKCQEQQLQRLSTFHEGIVQIGLWLDMMEKCVANDQSGQQAASLPEIRSHLLKQKTFLQDVTSHKRQVEALKERARSLVEDLSTSVGQGKDNKEIQKTIDDIGKRYDQLTAGLTGGIAHSEWLLDVLQQHLDLEKAQSDWQQQAWVQLNSNAGTISLSVFFATRFNQFRLSDNWLSDRMRRQQARPETSLFEDLRDAHRQRRGHCQLGRDPSASQQNCGETFTTSQRDARKRIQQCHVRLVALLF